MQIKETPEVLRRESISENGAGSTKNPVRYTTRAQSPPPYPEESMKRLDTKLTTTGTD